MTAQREDGLSAFRRRAEQVLDAFNCGDFEAAWGWLPGDFEFHPIPDWPDAEVARGPHEVIRYFQDEVREMFPDWRGQIELISEVAPDTYLNHLVMRGAGRAGAGSQRPEVSRCPCAATPRMVDQSGRLRSHFTSGPVRLSSISQTV